MLEVAGLALPAYDEHYASVIERKLNEEMIKGVVGDWRQIPAGSEQRFDGIVMRDGRYESHIGLVTQPGRMLHTYQGGASCNDRYQTSPFRERIIAFYRHQSFVKDA
jgi:hypothetical protein